MAGDSGLVFVIGLIALSLLAVRKTVSNLKKAIITLAAWVAAWVALASFVRTDAWFVASLQPVAPSHSVHPSLRQSRGVANCGHSNWRALSTSPRFYVGAWTIGALFLVAVLLNFVVPRFYCRFGGVGALFGILEPAIAVAHRQKRRRMPPVGDFARTIAKALAEPFEKIRSAECLMCMNCLDACKQNRLIAPYAGRREKSRGPIFRGVGLWSPR